MHMLAQSCLDCICVLDLMRRQIWIQESWYDPPSFDCPLAWEAAHPSLGSGQRQLRMECRRKQLRLERRREQLWMVDQRRRDSRRRMLRRPS
ncbi:unnamed protein product [Mycena citricolor]|uniref:Uncharacterized protein n=1 Tax=Mycena citricolor TaxID=2018698 RepID=A0AAD2HNH6_9AGAR|nr:unnamed protein product [Mycena citricolor]